MTAGFGSLESGYRTGWNSYVGSLKPAPVSVAGDQQRRRAYHVAAMALHAAEDKTFRGASVAGLATPWGDVVNGGSLGDGYHRVWGRDLYQQATGLLAAGDTAQPKRMAQFLWGSQWIGSPTAGDGTTYPAGAFPRYSPVSGVAGASAQQLGYCEQLDQDADAIVLAWLTGLTDAATYAKVKVTAEHLRTSGPATTERWEEQYGRSPSSIAAEIAGLVTADAIARANGDTASATTWESTADSWLASLDS
ncbi:glycoside hydrolase family 15 protein [Amycolatopsis carbonis]|uniref:Glycoside hydrolase family 15 protein n=1 Tax=Amycolatopsis carbonis TaxID=715471 RepID=A0A9Y2MS89_9PSEU|nr:glycoside hydrolase family 15 protein [Amycolatopsis sp. 2-15]WIX76346.1 glycoside hydrolase family 15 protein [Amycolatopsis sp. 2-15]